MGIISVFVITATLKDPKVIESMGRSSLPVSLQHAILALGVMVMTGCGLGILKGKNWARLLYLGWGCFSIAMSLALGTMEVSRLSGLFFYLVIAFFLFRPVANVYFSPENKE
jgi:hypothetical protein